MKCLYLARIGRPDILWSVNKLARSITKWTKACDKRLNRLISYIHHTCEYVNFNSVVLWVILQNNAGWDCFMTPILGEFLDSKSTSGGTLCVAREMGPQGMRTTSGGGLARVPKLRVCKHLLHRVAHAGGGRMN